MGRMTKEEYKEYLKSEHWQNVRAKRLKIDNHRCYLCGRAKALNVHHLRYDNLGNEDVKEDLVTLCYKCHQMLHKIIDGSKKEYNTLVYAKRNEHAQSQEKHAYDCLRSKVKSLLIEELWIRDSAFGGDLQIFEDKLKTVYRMSRIVRIIYPDIKRLNISGDVKREVKKISKALYQPKTQAKYYVPKPRHKKKKRGKTRKKKDAQ